MGVVVVSSGGDVRGQRCGNSVIIANCLCTRCVPATAEAIGRRVSVVSNPCVLQQTVRHGVITYYTDLNMKHVFYVFPLSFQSVLNR